MAQQQVQQEAVRLASQHELGVLQKEYGKGSTIGGLILFIGLALGSLFMMITLIKDSFTDPSPVAVFLTFLLFLAVFLILCYAIWYIYHSRYSRSFLYEYGYISMKCANKQIVSPEAIHWRDIASIWHHVSMTTLDDGTVSSTHSYTLERLDGTIFKEQIPLSAAGYIEQRVLQYLLPQAISTYQQGLPVVFGPTLHTEGIEYKGSILLWSDFANLKMDEFYGKLSIMHKSDRRVLGKKIQPWATISYDQIPNIAVLQRLIPS